MTNEGMPKQITTKGTPDQIPARPGWNVAWWVVDKVKKLIAPKVQNPKLINRRRGYRVCKGVCGQYFKNSEMTQIGKAAEYMFCSKCAQIRLDKIAAKTAIREAKTNGQA